MSVTQILHITEVVLELLSGQHTLNELAEKYQISPATLSSEHKQF